MQKCYQNTGSVLTPVHVQTNTMYISYRGFNLVFNLDNEGAGAGVKWPGNNHIFGSYASIENAMIAIDAYRN